MLYVFRESSKLQKLSMNPSIVPIDISTVTYLYCHGICVPRNSKLLNFKKLIKYDSFNFREKKGAEAGKCQTLKQILRVVFI